MENIWKAIKGYDKQWKPHNKLFKTAKTFEITIEPAHWPHEKLWRTAKSYKKKAKRYTSYEMVWNVWKATETYEKQ